MPAINDALAYIDNLDSGEKFEYSKVAKMYGVDRTTLSRQHRRVQRPRVTKDSEQYTLNPHQEAELVKYIKELTERRLPPTRSMIQNFASKLAKKDVSESWVTRFINRNKDELTSRWAPAMDSVRHNADSVVKYGLYLTFCNIR
jgi:hypothetical protein